MVLGFACEANDVADRLYSEARRAERAGDKLHAYLLYARAAVLDPANLRILARKDALAAAMALGAETQNAAPLGDADLDDLAAGELSPGEMVGAREVLPPPHLQAPPGKNSFDLKGSAQSVFEQVARAFGIQLVFEPDYQSPAATFQTGEMSMEEALRALETVTYSLVIPLDGKRALVVRDTPQRRADTSPAMFATIPIPERIAVADAQEIVTAVQQTLQIRTIAVDPGRRVVYLRDTVGKVIAARQMFSDLSRLRAQVEVDVELLAIDRNSSLGLGLSLPTSSAIVNFGNFLNNTVSTAGFTQFLGFGGGKSLFGLGVTGAQVFATLARSSSAEVFRSEVVTLDGQPATLHVGSRYPIITNGYFGNTSGTGTVYTPPPTVTFEDLGLVLKITPAVHDHGEMTLDVEANYKVLGAFNANGIPAISQRKYQGKVRLAADEWAVVAGLTEEDETLNSSGLAVPIPGLGRLFRKNTRTKDSTGTLIVLKPRLVNLPPWELPSHTLWVGSESKPINVY